MNKYFYENYALLSTCHVLGINSQDFKARDKPDLQSTTLNIGIEVVRAITEHDGLTYYLAETYFGKGLPGEEIVTEINQNNKGKRFKGFVCAIDGTAVISSENGMYDGQKHRNLIIQKIEEKSRLFKNYRHYKTNGLYCFAHTGLINELDYPYIIEACKKSPFSLVLIDCIDEILQWNSSLDTFIKSDIPEACLSKWAQDARKV